MYGPSASIHVANSTEGSIMCSGSMACANMDSMTWLEDGNAFIRCRGSASCLNVSLIRTRMDDDWKTSLDCYGMSACAESYLIDDGHNSNHLNCEGDASCARASINGYSNIHAGGYRALHLANIDSLFKNMSIEFRGYRSGDGAIVTCREGYFCRFECFGSSCANTSFICNSDNCEFTMWNTTFDETQYDHVASVIHLENQQECNGQMNGSVFDEANEKWGVPNIVSNSTICCRVSSPPPPPSPSLQVPHVTGRGKLLRDSH